MKTLQRALNITLGASIACWYFDVDVIKSGARICLMLIVILPTAAQFDGGSDEN